MSGVKWDLGDRVFTALSVVIAAVLAALVVAAMLQLCGIEVLGE
jgi:hypothetical protein